MNRTKQKTLISMAAGLFAVTLGAMPVLAQSIPPVVTAWAEAWNEGDSAGMAALFTQNGVYEDYAFQATWQGHEAIGQWVDITVVNIPGARAEIVNAYQAGDRATVRWVFHGTPERLGEIEGTGKTFAVSAVSVFELENGKISRVSDFYNLANLLRQLELDAGVWVPPFGPDVLK